MRFCVYNYELTSKSGFTFIEIMVAIAIFTLAVLAAVNVASGSVRATLDAKDTTLATFLLQQKIVALETEMETKGFEDGCSKKNEGKFEEPYSRFSWTTYCTEIDFYLSEGLLKTGNEKEEDGDEESSKNDDLTKMLLTAANDFLSKSIRELHVEVAWDQIGHPRTMTVTTHFADYNQPFMGGMPGGGDKKSEDSPDVKESPGKTGTNP